MAAYSIERIVWAFLPILFLFLVVGLPLIVIFTGDNIPSKDPTFSVESTTVKAYNLTLDNRLFCIINIGVKARNPNPKKRSFIFHGWVLEVTKGEHHKLADDALWNFRLGPGGDRVVDVEAVALHVGLEEKIAREVRDDAAAGEGRVNMYMSGCEGLDKLEVTCKNIVVDFSRLKSRVNQKVDCKVFVTPPTLYP